MLIPQSLCRLNSSVVYDKLLASLSLAVSEPKAKREETYSIDYRSQIPVRRANARTVSSTLCCAVRAATAQEVLEISPEAQHQFSKQVSLPDLNAAAQHPRAQRLTQATSLLSQKWFKSSPPFRRTSDSFLTRADRERLRTPIEQLAPPSKRSFLLLDRFSQSETIFFVSNDVVFKRPEEVSATTFDARTGQRSVTTDTCEAFSRKGNPFIP
jgi:hypothetical protein